MALTPSTMLELGTSAPNFELLDTAGRTVKLSDFKAKPLLVAFICNHCPYVKHIRQGFAALAEEYMAKGVAVVGINSNDASAYPDDSPQMMSEEVKTAGYTFPYLFDETQKIAQAYRAACTPDFYLFDSHHRLIYRGQMDGSRPNSGIPVTGADLRNALNAVLDGKPISSEQRASIGCNIKWKPNNEPDYFNK